MTFYPDDHDEDNQNSTTGPLAEALRLTVADFVEAFGAGWQLLPTREHGSTVAAAAIDGGHLDWHVAGQPFQLTLRPHDSGVELGLPVGRWSGHAIDWNSEDHRIISGVGPELLDVAPPIVAEMLKRRRAKFRYCRYCRSLTPPEERLSAGVCYGCGTRWHGLIY